jgi:hypothetical protein
MNILKVPFYSFCYKKFEILLFFLLEQINEGQEYDPRDIQRFNEIDDYTLMFIQHGQFGTSFDEDRALRIFNASMSWRKKHNVYGSISIKKELIFFFIDY